MIKSLKGIENGLGTILFIFPLKFLICSIVFVIFTCGIKEYQILSNTIFNILNIMKIICITLTSIFSILSLLYAILMIAVLIQYINLINIIDSCVVGIFIGMVYGYYGIWYYVVLVCAFAKERTMMINIENEEKPGPDAKYDIQGNPRVVPNAIVIIPSQQMILVQIQKFAPYQ